MPRERQSIDGRIVAGVIVGLGLLLLAIANIHLVYVAVDTQPDCVKHSKLASNAPGSFRAAKSAC